VSIFCGNLLPIPATPPGAVISFLIGGFPCIFDLSPGTYTVNSDGTGRMNLATRLDPAITLNQFAGCQIAAKVTVPLVFKFSVSNGGTALSLIGLGSDSAVLTVNGVGGVSLFDSLMGTAIKERP